MSTGIDLIGAGMAVIIASIGLLAAGWLADRPEGTHHRPRRPLLAWRWRNNWRPRLRPAAALTGAADTLLAWWLDGIPRRRPAARRWVWHRKRLLPSRPAPHPHHHDRLTPEDAATLTWIQAVKAPSPHAGWLALVTASTVWRALTRELEVQATRPWGDSTGTFTKITEVQR
jgi:hypothetical protein